MLKLLTEKRHNRFNNAVSVAACIGWRGAVTRYHGSPALSAPAPAAQLQQYDDTQQGSGSR